MIDEEYQDLLDSVEDITVDELEYNGELEELDDDLEHSGIFGMHWGKRRYQNEDGSYTELGKERRRVGKDMTRAEKRAAKKAKKKTQEARDFKEIKNIAIKRGDTKFAEKNYDKLTDDELNTLYNRAYMKTRITDIKTAETQSKLDKWVGYLDAAGKLSKSVDTIHSSISNISDRDARAKAEATKRKLEIDRTKLQAKKEKYEFDLEITDPRNKKEYREAMAELEKKSRHLANAKSSTEINKLMADIDKIKQDTFNSREANERAFVDWKTERKSRYASVSNPVEAKIYNTVRNDAYDNLKARMKTEKIPYSEQEDILKKFNEEYPHQYKDYRQRGGAPMDAKLYSEMLKAEKSSKDDDKKDNKKDDKKG